jgi:hypothetical protein
MVTVKRLTLLGLSLLGLAACHLVARTPAPPLLPSPTANLPMPVPATASPLTVLPNYLEDVHVISIDTFDDPSGWNPADEISNGQLLLVGSGDNDWHGLSNRAIFQEGNGVVIDFQFTPGEYFEMYFERGAWTTSNYKRFGVYVTGDHADINIFTGRERRQPNPISGNLSLSPDTWYSLALAVGRGGDFLAVIWDPADPGKRLTYREQIPNWNELEWTFRIQVNQGTNLFDDFEETVFAGIK